MAGQQQEFVALGRKDVLTGGAKLLLEQEKIDGDDLKALMNSKVQGTY